MKKMAKIKMSRCVIFALFFSALLSCSTNFPMMTSCTDAMEILPSRESLYKIQRIYPHGNKNSRSLEVLCDFETDGGGWTTIQKRSSGPKYDFNRTWTEYGNGFGSLIGNFWIGLENIRALTQNGDQELRVELKVLQGGKIWIKYSNFSVSPASDFYRLSISGFSGDAGSYRLDFFSWEDLDGMQFSTPDKDNDKSARNCAANWISGWWFNECHKGNLNGRYYERGAGVPKGTVWEGISWHTWQGFAFRLSKTEMKIRKRK